MKKTNKNLVFRMYAVLILWTTFFFFALFVPRKFQYKIFWPIFLKLYLFAVKLKPVYIYGEDLNKYKGVIFAINHKCFADSQMIMSLLKNPFALLYRRDVFKSPFFKFMAWRIGFIPIEGKEMMTSKTAFDTMKKRLSKNISVLYFPEGKHITQSHLGKFNKGIAKLAKETGVDVVPVAIYGLDDRFRFEDRLIWKNAFIKGGKPINFSQYNSDELFVRSLKEKIEGLYFEMHNELNLINY